VQRPEAHSLKLVLIFTAATTVAGVTGIMLHESSAPAHGAGGMMLAASSSMPLPTVRRALAVDDSGELPEAIPITEETVITEAHTFAPGSQIKASANVLPSRPIGTLTTQSEVRVLPPLPIETKPLPMPPLALNEKLRRLVTTDSPLPLVYQAVLLNDVDWLQDLLQSGFPVNVMTPGGDTALCAAVKAGYTEAVQQLILHGADVHQLGRDRQEPILLAAMRRGPAIINALLMAGADANATFNSPVAANLINTLPFPELKGSLRSDIGVTALITTVARGDVEGSLALLRHGARISKPTTKFYRYPINYAAEQRYLFLMRILLGRSAESEPDILVTVDLSQQKAWISKHGEIIDRTSVSTGREGFGTPTGRYLVTDKHQHWVSTIYDVEMPWFMRLNCSAIGLHSGHVTGRPASHGCIRLPYDKAKKWFRMVKVGDEVQIVR
jgi:L,D-transpeptidase catalytic domain/Ankyrin repeats (3 copies)